MRPGHYPFYNTEATDAPPGCALEPTGELDADGRLKVRKPTADDRLGIFVNGTARVPAGAVGECVSPYPGVVFGVHVDDALAPLDILGTEAGEWLLRKGRKGFVFVGGDPAGVRFGNAVPEPVSVGGPTGGSPVWNYNALFNPVPIVPTFYTEVLRVSIPSDGVYLISTFMTAVLDHTAGSSVFATVQMFGPGGGFLFSWGGVASNFLQADGVSAGSSAWQFVYPMSAGGSARLMAAVLTPSGTPAVAKVYGWADADYPTPAPVMAGTYISAVKLSGNAGGSSTVPPPPPSPPATGSVVGVAVLDGTPLSGRTVTLSGATSGTTTTADGGIFSFSPVNAGSNTVTLSLSGGETCEHQVDGGGFTAGNAAPVTVAVATTHGVKFAVTTPPTTGTLVVTVDLGAGYTATWSGGGTFVESPAGTHTLTGVAPATGGTVTLTGPGVGFGTTWTCDNPGTAGSSGTASPVDVDAGATTTVAFTV